MANKGKEKIIKWQEYISKRESERENKKLKGAKGSFSSVMDGMKSLCKW